MDASRRQFLVGAAALAAGTSVTPALASPPLRKRVVLEGHKDWELVRPHVLGHLSLDEMATGLPGPLQEYLACWDVEGKKALMPVCPDGKSIAKLPSGFLMDLDKKTWEPFLEKWCSEVGVPVHGPEIGRWPLTSKMGVALLTNISLWRMALKYCKK